MPETRKLGDIIYRKDLYPRIESNPQIIQRYADNIEKLPPIEINQHNILIDGYHRWTAHRKVNAETINVFVTETKSESELYGLSIKRNANHGLQLSEKDKKSDAIRLYNSGHGWNKDEIADILSVTVRMVNNYLHDIDRGIEEEKKQKAQELYLSSYTYNEISKETKVLENTIKSKEWFNLESFPKSTILLSNFQETDFKPPIYNVWTFAKKTNDVTHPGNSEQRILENLLYLYTEPFDIVIDPFAGGGSSLDICKKRLRRIWLSDRKPIVERENEIRKLDIVQELPPLNKRWSKVTLTYLDPPYWRQAQNKYSNDEEDLANMSLEDFTKCMIDVIKNIAKKQSKGVIAMLMQPTQWNADNREFTDHVFDIIQGVNSKNLILENRVSCPYSTEQANAQMVNWSKENKKLLVISRELVIWRFIND